MEEFGSVRKGVAVDRIISVGRLFSGNWAKEIELLPKHRRPLVIIKHSQPVAVLLDYGVYCEIEEKLDRLAEKVSQLSR